VRQLKKIQVDGESIRDRDRIQMVRTETGAKWATKLDKQQDRNKKAMVLSENSN
jgi:hypothetical protein